MIRRVLGSLRADLWTAAADPLPRMRARAPLNVLPHTLVVLFALALVWSAAQSPYVTYPLLAWGQAAALVLATSRPIPAWWLSTAVMVVGLWVVEPVREEGFPGPPGPLGPMGADEHAPPFPWTLTGMLMQAGVLLLMSLRVRPRAAGSALALTLFTSLVCTVLCARDFYPGEAVLGPPVFVAVTVLGIAVRGLRVARHQLVEQEEYTAEERARRALAETRNRIARELHDVVAHHMSVISIQAQVAPHLVDNPSEELKENLAGIRASAVEALTELRRVLGVLRTEDSLAEDAPQPALDRLDDLVAKVRAAGLTVVTRTTGEPRPLSPGLELSAYRILQEALSNAMRHAPGAEARVEICYLADALTLRVVNTRPRRPAPSSPGPGLGLLGMRERAAMLGGDLAAGPTPDGGYEVTAVLPAGNTR